MIKEFILDFNQPFAIFENQLDLEVEFPVNIFYQPYCQLKTNKLEDVSEILNKAEKLSKQGYFIVGSMCYEALNGQWWNPEGEGNSSVPLVFFVAFSKRAQFRGSEFEKLKFKDESGQWLEGPSLGLYDFELNETFESYKKKIERIKHYQREGDTYQVNFTMKNRFRWQGNPLQFFFELKKYQPVRMASFIHLEKNLDICSCSPELFFHKKEDFIVTKPMKGTARRGATAEIEEKIKSEMRLDPKTIAENLMIVDLIRNDLGRIARTGSVKVSKLFEVETYSTLLQMTSTIEAKVEPSMSFFEVMKALFPCGSVTGAPKKRTMEIISELEAESRGLYTGALGYILPGNGASEFLFNVAIRTVILNSEVGEMGIGSGIVYDSKIEEEWKECLLKGKFLKRINSRFQLIETFRYDFVEGVYLRLEMHLARLSKSALALGFELEEMKLRNSLEKLKENFGEDRRIRVALSQNGEFDIKHELFKKSDTNYKVIFCKTPINKNSMFQKFKTTYRDFYETNYQKAVSMGYDEVLFVNEDGKVVEASRHNIFVKRDSRFLTPPVSDGALPGVLRQSLLESQNLYWNGSSYLVNEKSLEANDVWKSAGKSGVTILLGNSLRGLIEARVCPIWIEGESHG